MHVSLGIRDHLGQWGSAEDCIVVVTLRRGEDEVAEKPVEPLPTCTLRRAA